MKRTLSLLALVAALLGFASPASAARQNIYSSKAIAEFQQALTAGGRFGAPGWATGSLPDCTVNERGLAYDTTTQTYKYCNGTSWAGLGGSGLTINTTTITGGTSGKLLYNNAGTVGELGLGTTTTVLHGNAAGLSTWGAVISADLNITTTSCTNQFVTAISAGGVGTCTTVTLAGAQFANQGTTTTLLHGAAAGNPSFGAVVDGDLSLTTPALGAPTASGITLSGLTASRIVLSDGSKNLVSNGSITTNALTKSASSGASLAASSVVDDGSTVTVTGESIVVANSAGFASFLGTNSLTTGGSTLELRNNNTTNAYFMIRNYGSGSAATFFGYSAANATGIFADGSSSQGIGFGTLTAKPVFIGTNNIAREAFAGPAKALTESAATIIANVAVASGTVTGGTIEYTIRADDGTDFQSRAGVLNFTAVNKAGTVTCTVFRPDGGTTVDNTTDGATVTSGTLTNTFTCVANANSVDIKANATSSLTQTTLNFDRTVRTNGGTGAISFP